MLGPHNGKGGFVYLPINTANTVLYTGVAADLAQRIWQHKAGCGSALTREYQCVSRCTSKRMSASRRAIARESQLKNWKHAWNLELVRNENPEYRDLATH